MNTRDKNAFGNDSATNDRFSTINDLIDDVHKHHPELGFLQLLYLAVYEAGWDNNNLFYCPDLILIEGLDKILQRL